MEQLERVKLRAELPLKQKLSHAIDSQNQIRLVHLLSALTETRSISVYAHLSDLEVELAAQQVREALIRIDEQKKRKKAEKSTKISCKVALETSCNSQAPSTFDDIIHANAKASACKTPEKKTAELTKPKSLPTPDQCRRIALAIEEARVVLHADDRKWSGWATVNYKPSDPNVALKQRSFRVSELEDVLADLICTHGGDHHLYLSQHTYSRPKRRIETLMTLNLLSLDLDIYKSDGFDFSSVSIQDAIRMVLARMDFYEIPRPSYIVSSGRGLQLKWLHQPVRPSAQGEWEKAQARLLAVFDDNIFAADKKAALKTQLLRLVGSTHQGSGVEVTVAWVNGSYAYVKSGDLSDSIRYDFNELVASICNYEYTRKEVQIFKKNLAIYKKWDVENKANTERLAVDHPQRIAAQAKKDERQTSWNQVNKALGRKPQPLSVTDDLNADDLWRFRIQMLERLVQLRHGSKKVPDGGRRHAFLWLIANAWAWILRGQSNIKDEIKRHVHDWALQHIDCDADYVDCAIQTVIHRSAHAHEWNFGPYKVPDQELIYKLDMSELELEQIKVGGLTTKSGRKNAKRKQWKNGIMGFEQIQGETYERYTEIVEYRQKKAADRTNALKRQKTADVRADAISMHSMGVFPMRQIGFTLGISAATVSRYVKDGLTEAEVTTLKVTAEGVTTQASVKTVLTFTATVVEDQSLVGQAWQPGCSVKAAQQTHSCFQDPQQAFQAQPAAFLVT